jgi:hypothetical protein
MGPQGPSGLPTSGTIGQTLRHDGASWVATSNLHHDAFSGYIGIGTVSPDSRLHVSGDVHSSGSFRSDNANILFAGGGNPGTSDVVLRRDGTTAYLFPWSTGYGNNRVSIGGPTRANLLVTGAIEDRVVSVPSGGVTGIGQTWTHAAVTRIVSKGGDIIVIGTVRLNITCAGANHTYVRVMHLNSGAVLDEQVDLAPSGAGTIQSVTAHGYFRPGPGFAEFTLQVRGQSTSCRNAEPTYTRLTAFEF